MLTCTLIGQPQLKITDEAIIARMMIPMVTELTRPGRRHSGERI